MDWPRSRQLNGSFLLRQGRRQQSSTPPGTQAANEATTQYLDVGTYLGYCDSKVHLSAEGKEYFGQLRYNRRRRERDGQVSENGLPADVVDATHEFVNSGWWGYFPGQQELKTKLAHMFMALARQIKRVQ